jgi:hypothetical protein
MARRQAESGAGGAPSTPPRPPRPPRCASIARSCPVALRTLGLAAADRRVSINLPLSQFLVSAVWGRVGLKVSRPQLRGPHNSFDGLQCSVRYRGTRQHESSLGPTLPPVEQASNDSLCLLRDLTLACVAALREGALRRAPVYAVVPLVARKSNAGGEILASGAVRRPGSPADVAVRSPSLQSRFHAITVACNHGCRPGRRCISHVTRPAAAARCARSPSRFSRRCRDAVRRPEERQGCD